ncbi:hypothetical protein [Amycolatopsis sp. NPDC021455]|uniref:hypothetical protein n=1 Tax=Amycolatopsis sp. NPDC021455 TaxID=3154901 RepID=UPI0033DCCDC0
MTTTGRLTTGVTVSSTMLEAAGITAGSGTSSGTLPPGTSIPDPSDAAIIWWVPEYVLATDPDTAFAFTAHQDDADAQGNPFATAELTLSLRKLPTPSGGEAMLAAVSDGGDPGGGVREPDPTYRDLPLSSAAAVLSLPYRDSGGNLQALTFPGQVTTSGDGLVVTVKGLLGSTVILAYTALTATGDISVELDCAYPGLPGKGRTHVDYLVPPALAADDPGVGAQPSLLNGNRTTFAIGLKYASPSYTPRYTVTAGGATATITSAAQLKNFDVRQSEYFEVTALGDIASKYPSFRALYLGSVSGTALAVPAAYGTIRGRDGCAQECDAVLDAGASGGCTFQLSFDLGPVVDPVDLERLRADLAAAPLVRGRWTYLTMPSLVDTRSPLAFSSPLVDHVVFTGGVAPQTFALTASIGDGGDGLPAIVKANLVLKQLCSPVTEPLVGRFALRLDEAHEETIPATVVLNLRTTAGSDGDIAVDVTDPAAPVVRNAMPRTGLRLTGFAARTGGVLTTTALDTVLAPGETAKLAPPPDTDAIFVRRTLAVPNPLPPGALTDYVTVNTETVQAAHHVIGLNATGVDFARAKLKEIAVAVTLTGLPDLAVPVLHLAPGAQAASTQVDIPILYGLTEVAAALAITLVSSEPGTADRRVSLTHDFGEHPIRVLTRGELGLPG